jgi:pimeloyl-ACP methyl ester carboxylesterase
MKKGRFTEEQIIGILKQHEAGRKVPELAREIGVSDATIYTWKSKYGGMEVGEAQRLKGLEDENRRLKPKQIPVLARGHRVIAVEQMGHGHTPDVSGREMSYEGMSEDTAALLRQLGIQDADLIGWSDGGQLALRLAFTHPELVTRVIVSGVGFGAKNKEAPTVTQSSSTSSRWPKSFREEYARTSPDGPEHWSVVLEKARKMWAKPNWGISKSELARIKAPTLIVAGDRDLISVEQTTLIFRSVPNARLCVLPATGHWTFQNRPDWLNLMILDFLDGN